jgi:hypothetical protein
MEAIDLPNKSNNDLIFNSPLETGVRSVIILNASYPLTYELSQLTWLDHLIVHSADVGGPPSIHPDVPQRSGEILIRRRLVENGLNMMRRLHMVEVAAHKEGILYSASDEAEPFVELMSTQYSNLLKERAKWLAEDIGKLNHKKMKDLIIDRLDKWTIEFDEKINIRDLR